MLRTLSVLAVAVICLVGLTPGAANAGTTHPEAATITGAPALIIILVILALIVIGIIAVVRFIARKGRDVL